MSEYQIPFTIVPGIGLPSQVAARYIHPKLGAGGTTGVTFSETPRRKMKKRWGWKPKPSMLGLLMPPGLGFISGLKSGLQVGSAQIPLPKQLSSPWLTSRLAGAGTGAGAPARNSFIGRNWWWMALMGVAFVGGAYLREKIP